MVSERYDSMDRELQMTYSAFDYIADDRIQQKDESRKEVSDIHSIVANFKQQFRDQFTMFRRDLLEMIREEVNIISSQYVLYIEKPMQSGGSSPSEIGSRGFNSTDEAVIPDLIHDCLMVEAVIGNEKEEENKEKNEEMEESIYYCEDDSSQNDSGIHSELIQPVYQLPPISPIGFMHLHDSTSGFKSHSYLGNPSNPGRSPTLMITSGMLNPTGEESVQPPDLSQGNINVTTCIGNEEEGIQEHVFGFTSKTKSIPNLSMVTMTIEEEGREAEEQREKEFPIERKEDRSILEGSQKSIFNVRGYQATKAISIENPESGVLGFRPDLDPDPPDLYSPPRPVGLWIDSTTRPSRTENVVFWTDSSNPNSSISRKEVTECDHVRPNSSMGRETAQGIPSPIASKYGLLFGPISHLYNPEDDVTTLVHQVSAQNSINSFNASKEGSMIRIAEGEDSRVWKTEIAQRKLDHLDSPELISASIDHRESDSTRYGYGRQSGPIQVVADLQRLSISPAIEPNQSIIRLDNHFEPSFFPPRSKSTERRSNVGFQFVTTENEKTGNKTHLRYCHVTQTQSCYSKLARAQLVWHFQFHDTLQIVGYGRDGWSGDQRQLPPPPPPPPSLSQPPLLPSLFMPQPPSVVGGESGLKASFDIRIYWNSFVLLPVEKEKPQTEVVSFHLGNLPCFLDEVKMQLWLWRCPLGGDMISATKGLASRLKGLDREELAAASKQEDDVSFYQMSSANLVKLFHIDPQRKHPTLVLLKKEDEKVSHFGGTFVKSAITEFVSKHKLPLVIYLTRASSSQVFENPIKKQVILFTTLNDMKKFLPTFQEAAKYFMGEALFVYVPMGDEDAGKPVAEYFSIDGDTPRVIAFTGNDHALKFFLDEFVSWQNCGGDTFAEKHWTPTLVLEGNGDKKPTCKASTSMAVGWGDTMIGLLPFLNFFYPP